MYLVASLLKCKGTAAGDHFLLWCLCPFGGAFFSGEETRSCKGNQKASASHVSRTQKHGTLLFVRTSYLADFLILGMPVSTGLPAQLWAVRLLFARWGFVGLDEMSLVWQTLMEVD